MTSFKKGLKTCAALLGAAIWVAMVWGMAYTGLLFVTFDGAVWLNQIIGYGMIVISFCMTTLLFLIDGRSGHNGYKLIPNRYSQRVDRYPIF